MGTENKVNVVKTLGAGSALGVMTPRPLMVSQQGTIIAVASDGATVTVSGTSVSTLTTFYPHQLYVSLDVASGSYSWPTGDGSVVYTRSGIWPSGPVVNEPGSGYLKAGWDKLPDTISFIR